MESLFQYIIQVNVLLLIIYIGYKLFLERLTFYRLNRMYLNMGIWFSILYPFLNIKNWFSPTIVPEIPSLFSYMETIEFGKAEPAAWTYLQLFYVFLAVGITVLFIRFLIQLLSFYQLHRNSKEATWNRFTYQHVFHKIAPFSFFSNIYVHTDAHNQEELTKVFEHEWQHVSGYHSYDRIFSEIMCIVCWYNPIIWLLRRHIVENLEFLTDSQVLASGLDKKAYQYSLISVRSHAEASGLANSFNFNALKKRIAMMNKKKSKKIALTAYGILIPGMIFAAAAFTVEKAESNIQEIVERSSSQIVENPLKSNWIEADTSRMEQSDTISAKKSTFIVETEKMLDKKSERSHLDSIIPDKKYIEAMFVSPQYFIDGKEASHHEFQNISSDKIKSITILKNKQVIGKEFSEADKLNGVIMVETKSKPNLDKDIAALSEELKGKMNGIRSIESVKESDNNPGQKLISKTVVIRPKTADAEGNTIALDPLIILNEKEIKSEELKALDPNTIESINVIKGETAMLKYGAKGSNGVLQIILKK